MTKQINNPAPTTAELQTPEVYDRWLDGETLYVWLTGEDAPRQINFPDNFEPGGCEDIDELRGGFVVLDDHIGGLEWRDIEETYFLPFSDHLDQAVTDDYILWRMGLVARVEVRVKDSVKDRHGFRTNRRTIYASTPADALAFAREFFGPATLCIGAPTFAPGLTDEQKEFWYQ